MNRLLKFPLLRGFLCVSALGVGSAQASSLSFSLSELLGSEDTPSALFQQLVQPIDDAEVSLDQGEIMWRQQRGREPLRNGCNSSSIEWSDLRAWADRNSQIQLDVNSLLQPIQARADLRLRFDIRAGVQQQLGVRVIGDCVRLGQESFDALANGSLAIALDLHLEPNLQETSAGQFTLAPKVRISAQARDVQYSIDVDDSLLEPILERYLEQQVEQAFSDEQIHQQARDIQAQLQSQIDEALGSEAVQFAVPMLRGDRSARFQQWLSERAGLPLPQSYIDSQRPAIVQALLAGDTQGLEDLLETATACDAARVLLVPPNAEPVYQAQQGQCQALSPPLAAGRYADASCQTSFDFEPSDYTELCLQAFGQQHFGDATEISERWTLSAGSRIDIGAELQEDTPQAYMLRQRYRSIEGPRGVCHLEMRVYKAHPTRFDDKAMVAFHGGAWRFRGTGVIGLESSINHWVQAGYTVYLPFYRLSGEKDAPPACRGVAMDAIIEDAEAALDWVQAQAPRYANRAERPTLFGQSAGGTLAAYLATHYPDRVGKTLVFYAPLDFARAFEDWQSGRYTNRDGIRTLSEVLQRPPEQIQASDADVQRYSLNRLIARSGVTKPPMWLFYGGADELVPSSQATEFCAASLGRTPEPVHSDERWQHFDCDGVQLSLFHQADHALDYCYDSLLCPSGDLASTELVASTLRQARQWASSDAITPELPFRSNANSADMAAIGSGGGSGGGMLNLGMLALLVGWGLVRRRGLC